jgi:hypothetical protein
MSENPKFTRRHYEELAKAIAEADLFSECGASEYNPEVREGVETYRRFLLQTLRAKLTEDDPNFSEQKFLNRIETLKMEEL